MNGTDLGPSEVIVETPVEADRLPPVDCLKRIRRARILWNAGNHDGALDELREAVGLWPREVLPLMVLLGYHRSAPDEAEAFAETKRMLRRRLQDPEQPVAFATLSLAVDDPDATDEELRWVLDRLDREYAGVSDPDDRVLKVMAALQARVGDYGAARATVQRLLDRDPTVEVLWAAVSIDRRAERWEDVARELEAVVKLDPEPFWLQMLLNAYARLGRHEDVLRVAGDLRSQAADLVGTPFAVEVSGPLIRAAWALRDRDMDDAARRTFEEALKFDAKNEEATAALRLLYGGPGERAAWVREHDAAVTGATDPAVLLDEGSKQLVSGDAGQAFELLSRATEAKPDVELAWFNLGLAATKLERWSDAARALERARALNPGRPETLLNLGAAQQHLGRCDDALATMDALLTIEPSMYQAYYYVYQCRLARGERAEAIRALGKYNAGVEGK